MEFNKQFSINAKACTLKHNSLEGNATILGDNRKYNIPIYQRPYSWTDEQLRKFVIDIFNSYWGNDGNSLPEPMFIGTMQLTHKNDNNEQDIVDGQQRLTTLLIIIKVLKHKFPNCSELNSLRLDWLKTDVNKPTQQGYLSYFISSQILANDETSNPYLKNALILSELIEEQIKDEEGKPLEFTIDNFVQYFLSNIYFVVIETQAPLSKTLQIFNAINTTGLDLNGGDIFKIQMFDYLTIVKKQDKAVFEDINSLYHRIDKSNVSNIREVLGIYQYILISKYELPIVLYSYSSDRFYDELFETLLGRNPWPNFKTKAKLIEVSLNELNRLVDARTDWEKNWFKTAEDMCCYKLISSSRYAAFSDVLPTILLFSKPDANRYLFIRLLSKLYFIYSIRFQKSIYAIRDWTYSLIKSILNDSFDTMITSIKDQIGTLEIHNPGYNDLNYLVAENLTENAKRKNLICRLSAMLEEDYKTDDEDKIADIKKNLFDETYIDIEHIQSYHDSNGDIRQEIWAEWKDDINSIGNLMVLEQEINRSISNNPYESKSLRYPDSAFAIAKKQAQAYPIWNLSNCLDRKKKESQKILNYIFTN